MLTRTHLAVLRAALQYFQEELVPHGLDAIQPYLDEALGGEITSVDVQALQQLLRDADLSYAVLDSSCGHLLEITLYRSAEEATEATPDTSHRLVVVIIPSQT